MGQPWASIRATFLFIAALCSCAEMAIFERKYMLVGLIALALALHGAAWIVRSRAYILCCAPDARSIPIVMLDLYLYSLQLSSGLARLSVGVFHASSAGMATGMANSRCHRLMGWRMPTAFSG